MANKLFKARGFVLFCSIENQAQWKNKDTGKWELTIRLKDEGVLADCEANGAIIKSGTYNDEMQHKLTAKTGYAPKPANCRDRKQQFWVLDKDPKQVRDIPLGSEVILYYKPWVKGNDSGNNFEGFQVVEETEVELDFEDFGDEPTQEAQAGGVDAAKGAY